MIVRERLQPGALRAPFLKAVADVARGVVAAERDLHVDCAEELLQDGSSASDLWGFNTYPDGRLDFVSLLNIRPANGNRTLEIGDQAIRGRIEEIARPMLP